MLNNVEWENAFRMKQNFRFVKSTLKVLLLLKNVGRKIAYSFLKKKKKQKDKRNSQR